MNSFSSLKFQNTEIVLIYAKDKSPSFNTQVFDIQQGKTLGEASTRIPNTNEEILNLTCQTTTEVEKKFRCMFLSLDQLITEVDLKHGSGSQMTVESSAKYFKYPYILTSKITMDDKYFALLGQDPAQKETRILLYRLQSSQGSKHLYYSLKINNLVNGNDLSKIDFFLYQNTENSVSKNFLAVKNLASQGLAKIYEVKETFIGFKEMGYYDMIELKRIFFDIVGGTGKTSKKLFEMFFKLRMRSTQDRVGLSFFSIMSSLKYLFIGIGAILFLAMCCVGCYCIRRERIKASLND